MQSINIDFFKSKMYDKSMLEVKNLSCEINNQKVLDDLSFTAKNGKILALTGTNGSGKTTLLKVISGILPTKDGNIFLDNADITKSSITERAKAGISFAFQHPVLFKGLTVQNLLEIANTKAKKVDFACDVLSQVGLCARDYLNREFNKTLSGGERKRIELALTLARDAKVNIFDEPESGIDMWGFEKLTQIFEKLKNQKKCVIIVTHNQHILEMADTIIVMNKGRIEKSGTAKAILPHLKEQKCIKLSKIEGGQN